MKKILTVTLLLAITLFSCETENSQEEIKLESFGAFDMDVKSFFQETKIDLTKYRGENAESTIKAFDNQVSTIIDENDLISVKYLISLESENIIVFSNFDVVSKNGQFTVGDAIDAAYECPSGLTLVDSCLSPSCVEDAITGLAGDFSSGETITIYHNGNNPFGGGVKICSDVKN